MNLTNGDNSSCSYIQSPIFWFIWRCAYALTNCFIDDFELHFVISLWVITKVICRYFCFLPEGGTGALNMTPWYYELYILKFFLYFFFPVKCLLSFFLEACTARIKWLMMITSLPGELIHEIEVESMHLSTLSLTNSYPGFSTPSSFKTKLFSTDKNKPWHFWICSLRLDWKNPVQ